MASKTVISGMGCLCSAGISRSEIQNNLYAAKRNPAPPRRIEVSLDDQYPVFEIPEIPQDRQSNESLSSFFTRYCAEQACREAGLDLINYPDKKRIGVCIGTTVGCTLNNEDYYRDFYAGKKIDNQPLEIYQQNQPALVLSRLYGTKGPLSCINNACSSGTDALGMGLSWIEAGLCDIVLAGGSDELSRISYLGFISLLNTSQEACMPFDKNRSGLNLGEGAAVLVLEKAEHAQKRGARALGHLLSYASATDAYHPTAPHPEGLGLQKAIHSALKKADLQPEQLAFVNAHGTSTQGNDQAEGRALAEIFGEDLLLSSTKSATGHCLGAAGALEACFSLQSLKDKKLSPTIGFQEADPECRVKPVNKVTEFKGKYALSTSLAFGGNNSCIVLGAADD